MSVDVGTWVQDAARWLREQWGIGRTAADQFAWLLLYFYYYNLNPRITSGYRSPEKQESLRRRAAAGEPGIYTPAKNSLHTRERWGRPASQAIDIATSDELLAAQIARYLGIGAGYFFSRPDPVHFFVKGTTS